MIKKQYRLLETIATKSNFSDIKGERLFVDVAFTRNQLEESKKFGVDLLTKIESVTMVEHYQQIEKNVIGSLLDVSTAVQPNVETLVEFAKLLDDIANDNKIIITNGRIAMYIQELFKFKPVPIEKISNGTFNPNYFLGTYQNIQVFVDANMEWSSNKMLTYDNDVELTILENSVKNEIIEAENLPKKNTFSIEVILKIGNVNSVVYEINEIN